MSVLIDTLNLGASQTNSGDYSAAIETYLGAIEIDDRSATAWFCLGVLYSKTGSKIDAVEAFERSDAICPDHPPTLANLAYLLAESEPERAGDLAKRAAPHLEHDQELAAIASKSKPEEIPERVFIESQPIHQDLADNDPDADNYNDIDENDRKEEARTLSSSGDHSTAVSIWKDLLEQTPDSPEVWRGLGEALRSAGYNDRSEQCLKRAEQLESQASRESMQDATTVLDEAEVDDDEFLLIAAEESLHKSEFEERGSLDDSLGWYNMGINLLNEGKNEEALSSFEKAIGGCPSSEVELRVKAQNGRGNALYNAGRYPESVVAYHTAIGLDPQSVSGRTLFNMGSSYAAVEMFNDAIKCFTQALERGLEKSETELCEKQISRCRILSREQAKRQSRGIR